MVSNGHVGLVTRSEKGARREHAEAEDQRRTGHLPGPVGNDPQQGTGDSVLSSMQGAGTLGQVLARGV